MSRQTLQVQAPSVPMDPVSTSNYLSILCEMKRGTRKNKNKKKDQSYIIPYKINVKSFVYFLKTLLRTM